MLPTVIQHVFAWCETDEEKVGLSHDTNSWVHSDSKDLSKCTSCRLFCFYYFLEMFSISFLYMMIVVKSCKSQHTAASWQTNCCDSGGCGLLGSILCLTRSPSCLSVIQSLIALVNDPQPEHPLRADLAEEYSKDRKKFLKNAEEFTKKHGEKRPMDWSRHERVALCLPPSPAPFCFTCPTKYWSSSALPAPSPTSSSPPPRPPPVSHSAPLNGPGAAPLRPGSDSQAGLSVDQTAFSLSSSSP